MKLDTVALAQLIKSSQDRMQENMPMIVDLYDTIARERMIRYNAHIKAGFSPDQALFLCKEH